MITVTNRQRVEVRGKRAVALCKTPSDTLLELEDGTCMVLQSSALVEILSSILPVYRKEEQKWKGIMCP